MRRIGRGSILALTALAVLTLGSCTWFLSILNHMELDGEIHELDKLIVVYVGTDEDDPSLHLHFVYFFSEGVDLSLTDGFSGNGEGVVLGFAGPSRTLSDGEYTYSDTAVQYALAGGGALVNASFTNGQLGTRDLELQADGGSVFIRETLEDDYVFLFDIDGYDYDTPARRLTLDGRYRGEIDAEYDATVSFAMSGSAMEFNFVPQD